MREKITITHFDAPEFEYFSTVTFLKYLRKKSYSVAIF